MPAALSTRSFVLVTPDMINFKWERPIYCKVKKVNARSVQIEGLHDAAGETWVVSKSALLNRTVSAQEARSSTHGPLLRQPVLVQHQDAYHFGQVVSASEGQATINLLDQTITARTDFITPVAPVVALLLYELTFSTSEWSLDELLDMSHAIVDAICGSGTSSGTTNIASIAGAFVESTSLPQLDVDRTWIDPTTGETTVFPLQHAIDYAHYVDGNNEPVPASIGTSFCHPPRRQRPARLMSSADSLTLFNPMEDDDDNSIPEPVVGITEANLASRRASASRKRTASIQLQEGDGGRKRPNVGANDTLQTDTQIAHLLLNHPELTERFLQLQADAANASHENSMPSHSHSGAASRVVQPAHAFDSTSQQPAPQLSEVVPRSKYAFTPSVPQKQIHALATAPAHEVKSPTVFIEGLINSRAVTFKPAPSVLVQAYDLSFGIRGLSIMHFAPLKTLNEKAVWILTAGVNMQNFSAAVPLPPAVQAESLDDVLDALQALEIYGTEYFSAAIKELVSTLVAFTKQQLRSMVWQQVDLMLVVFWMNSRLENIRVELETGSSDGSSVKFQCSLDNPDLRQIILQIQQRQIMQLQQAMSQSSPPRPKPKGPALNSSGSSLNDRSSRKVNRVIKNEFAIPPDVYALLPVRNDKRLCLRYISNSGCRSSSNTDCTGKSRAHFVPDSLDPRVWEFIADKFGGVKTEHANL